MSKFYLTKNMMDFNKMNDSKFILVSSLDINDIEHMYEMLSEFFPGEWVHFKIHNNISYFRYKENKDSDYKYFHWLELCLSYLFPYLFEYIKWDTHKKDFSLSYESNYDSYSIDYNSIDKESFIDCFILNNPVEYLYHRFERIQNPIVSD